MAHAKQAAVGFRVHSRWTWSSGWSRFDTEGLLFQNLNSMQDYEAARERLEKRPKS